MKTAPIQRVLLIFSQFDEEPKSVPQLSIVPAGGSAACWRRFSSHSWKLPRENRLETGWKSDGSHSKL